MIVRLTAAEVRRMREDASDNLERYSAEPRPRAPGAQHLRSLLIPRESRIVRLCDELLDFLEATP